MILMTGNDLKVEYRDGNKVVALSGKLDSSTARGFADQVLSRCDCAVTMDLTDLKYISSAGIRAIVLVNKTIPVNIIGASGLVAEVLEISGMDKILG